MLNHCNKISQNTRENVSRVGFKREVRKRREIREILVLVSQVCCPAIFSRPY